MSERHLHLLLTSPEVNQAPHSLLVDGVKTLLDALDHTLTPPPLQQLSVPPHLVDPLCLYLAPGHLFELAVGALEQLRVNLVRLQHTARQFLWEQVRTDTSGQAVLETDPHHKVGGVLADAYKLC